MIAIITISLGVMALPNMGTVCYPRRFYVRKQISVDKFIFEIFIFLYSFENLCLVGSKLKLVSNLFQLSAVCTFTTSYEPRFLTFPAFSIRILMFHTPTPTFLLTLLRLLQRHIQSGLAESTIED